VLRLRHNLQVFRLVVVSVAVDVMNDLTQDSGIQFSSQHFFSDYSVFMSAVKFFVSRRFRIPFRPPA